MSQDHEENTSFGLSELQDSTEEEFQSCDKKNNNIVNGNCRPTIEFQTRKKAKSKRGYDLQSWCDFPGEAMKIVKTRAPQLSVLQTDNIYENKIEVTSELYKSWEDSFINIPEELFIEILSRLPLRSLARFKCVSNHWLSLILNDVFGHKLFIISYSKLRNYSLCLLDNKTREEIFCSPLNQQLLGKTMAKAHSSCRGLLLIQIHYDLFVWNPLTNFFKKMFTLFFHILLSGEYPIVVDLCYCYASDEYKVVLIRANQAHYGDGRHCYVATFGGKRWETIDACFEDVFQGPFFRGYRHWIRIEGNHRDSRRMYIVYFDPSTNKFIEVVTSKPKEGEINIFQSLGVYNECLCVTRWNSPKYFQNMELLVMKEYGNGNSWEVMFVFSNMPEFCTFDEMKLLFKTKEGEIWIRMNMYHSIPCVKAFDVNGIFLRDIWDPMEDYSPYGDFCDIISYEEISFSPTRL